MDVIACAAYTYALGDFTTVIDGIIGPWMLDHFETHSTQHPDLTVHYVVLRPRRDITLKRAQAQTVPNALIDEGPILSMRDQFSNLGTLDAHVLDTSGEAEEQSIRQVIEAIRDGRFKLFAGQRRNPPKNVSLQSIS